MNVQYQQLSAVILDLHAQFMENKSQMMQVQLVQVLYTLSNEDSN